MRILSVLRVFELTKGPKTGPKSPRGEWRPPGVRVGSSHSNLPTAGVCGSSYFARKAEKWVFWVFLGFFDITKGPKRGPKVPSGGWRLQGEWVGSSLSNLPPAGVWGPSYFARKAENCAFCAFQEFWLYQWAYEGTKGSLGWVKAP